MASGLPAAPAATLALPLVSSLGPEAVALCMAALPSLCPAPWAWVTGIHLRNRGASSRVQVSLIGESLPGLGMGQALFSGCGEPVCQSGEGVGVGLL